MKRHLSDPRILHRKQARLSANVQSSSSIAFLQPWNLMMTNSESLTLKTRARRFAPSKNCRASSNRCGLRWALLLMVSQLMQQFRSRLRATWTFLQWQNFSLLRFQASTPAMLPSRTGGTNVPGFDGHRRGNQIPDLVDILNGTGLAHSAPIFGEMEPGQFRCSGGWDHRLAAFD